MQKGKEVDLLELSEYIGRDILDPGAVDLLEKIDNLQMSISLYINENIDFIRNSSRNIQSLSLSFTEALVRKIYLKKLSEFCIFLFKSQIKEDKKSYKEAKSETEYTLNDIFRDCSKKILEKLDEHIKLSSA